MLQETEDWLNGDDSKRAIDQGEVGPKTPEKPGGIPWGEAKADANSPEVEQPELLDDYWNVDVLDDESDFTVVESKKKKKGKQAAQAGAANVPRERGRRRV